MFYTISSTSSGDWTCTLVVIVFITVCAIKSVLQSLIEALKVRWSNPKVSGVRGKICDECGTTQPANANHCARCGSKL